MSKDAKIEPDLLKINGNMAPSSGRILKTLISYGGRQVCAPGHTNQRL